MRIEEMEQRFRELKGRFDAGALSAKKFESQVAALQFRDAQNRLWMIGVQSGNWYWYDGAQWVAGQPSAPAEPVASQPPPESNRRVALPPVARPPAPAASRTGGWRHMSRSSRALLWLIILECIALAAVAGVLFVLLSADGNTTSSEPVGDAGETVNIDASGIELPAPAIAPPVANDQKTTNALAAEQQEPRCAGFPRADSAAHLSFSGLDDGRVKAYPLFPGCYTLTNVI